MAVQNKFKYGMLALIVSASLTGCGLDGDDGEAGPQGAQGPQGEQGAAGNDGVDGTNGSDGTNGADGTDAFTGISMGVVGRALLNAGGAAEIVQYHAETQTVYALNSSDNAISVVNASGLTSAELADPINTVNLNASNISLPSSFEGAALGGANSIAISGNLMAVAMEADNATDNGYVLFYNGLETGTPTFIDAVEVGALPDMVIFTPDGGRAIVANEGEPSGDYTVDPEGSISVIDILANGEPEETGETVSFAALNDSMADLVSQGVHFPNPAGRVINGQTITTTVAQDLEPEYITTTNDTAYVTLQENNALAIVDLEELTVSVIGLGFKDWSGLDFDGNEDGAVSFGQYDGLYGVYMPDTIASFTWKGAPFLVTANEGDAREYFFDTINPDTGLQDEALCTAAGGQDFDEDDGCLAFTEEVQIEDLVAEPGSLLEAIKADGRIDDLRVTNVLGDADGDGEYDAAFTYGARSFTIWDQNGLVVFDSGDDIGRITASIHGSAFNNGDDENEGDSRSENKGAEPEALTVGTVGDRTYAFVGLERMGGIIVYDVTNPYEPFFAEYVINRDLTEGLTNANIIGDLAPESLVFVSAEDSPSGNPLLLVGNEVSGTLTAWQILAN